MIVTSEERPCEREHDGEVIATLQLPEGLTGDLKINLAMLDGCKGAETAAKARQGDDRTYYGRPLGPTMANYQQGWRDYTCSLTVSNHQGGPRLTGHLH
ncbi:hypothetical protein F7Q99_05720 [Streptomyces kaniharaensis]|uniref:Septum formation-related domain-containing protein n=1 Tax=Streptomyces kaniharaensis TaxID=212423 RepID=A0A6N7KMK2_9ACTN|nr:hypothetical protein [Streptomyces kaniharaensis]